MMAPEPDMRPTIEGILLHPSLAPYLERTNKFQVTRTTSLPVSNACLPINQVNTKQNFAFADAFSSTPNTNKQVQ